jgi:hypothetical protein
VEALGDLALCIDDAGNTTEALRLAIRAANAGHRQAMIVLAKRWMSQQPKWADLERYELECDGSPAQPWTVSSDS